jgi:anti-sigma-K factor RskA
LTATASSSPFATATPMARLIVRIDALFEATLAACCAALAVATPSEGVWRLPPYLTATMLAAASITLIAVAALLWWLSGRPERPVLVLLGAANAGTALVTMWYAVTANAGSGIGLLLGGAALMLTALATSQAALALGSSTGLLGGR